MLPLPLEEPRFPSLGAPARSLLGWCLATALLTSGLGCGDAESEGDGTSDAGDASGDVAADALPDLAADVLADLAGDPDAAGDPSEDAPGDASDLGLDTDSGRDDGGDIDGSDLGAPDASDATADAPDAAAADARDAADADAATDADLGPDLVVPFPEVRLGVLRAGFGTLYGFEEGTTVPIRIAERGDCGARGLSVIAEGGGESGFWLCASEEAARERFWVGNRLGDAIAFSFVHDGVSEALPPPPEPDSCPRGRLEGRAGTEGDGFWLCRQSDGPRYAHTWEFNGDDGGWTAGIDVSLAAGESSLDLTVATPEAELFSPPELGLDADLVDTVFVRLANPIDSQGMLFQAVLYDDLGEPTTVVQTLPLVPSRAGFRIYELDLSELPEWQGTLEQISLRPVANEFAFVPPDGRLDIDWLRLGNGASHPVYRSFDFDEEGTTDGWAGTTGSTRPFWSWGVLALEISGPDAGIRRELNPPVDITNRQLRIRVLNSLIEGPGEVFFSRPTNPGFRAEDSVPFAMVSADLVMREYVVDMTTDPEWSGPIDALRIDFGTAATGPVGIDRIRFTE